ncbi:MAG TPA: alpha-1,4-glucan--maltose-1-phosphate maltosyltransferase [Acidimicrobiales bacterium]|nr:alpha-1,4-glucan--maltose-1-phosphate maltosyltransferase [Acidimicrobiales bacterium]
MTGRIVIDDLRPRTPSGEHPAKAVIGEAVRVSADVFRDGHVVLAGRVRWRPQDDAKWSDAPMRHLGNDRWEAVVEPAALGMHVFAVEAWTDRYATWAHETEVKHGAGQDVAVECEDGARLLESRAPKVAKGDRALLADAAARLRDASLPVADRLAAGLDPAVAAALEGVPDPIDLTASRPHNLWVDRERALVGAWYELFPRSEGGLRAAADNRLPAVAEMGFDVVYLPPIHPIGRSHRKGRNNTLDPGPDDPGSPWAIGAAEGGHTDVHPELGTLADFDHFVEAARALGMEVALDYALQCSPDHPWVGEHPEWFHHRSDGSIQYAENPPKKYQDIYPINFWPESEAARVALWEACREIVEFWIGHGVRIFRVDNPHTKPFAFWEWMIPAIQADHPDIVFLAEAFTRPKIMAMLAQVGFSQSYTYFTWRTGKAELAEYLDEIAHGPKADYMRPNFWPNTPDILSGPLRNGPPAAFKLRLVLAALMVPSYGVYSGYELSENQPASDANEEYLWSEKYEIKQRDWSSPDSIAPLVIRINQIRRRHPAFAELRNIRFHASLNDNILAWSKHTDDLTDIVLVVVNLDPHAAHEDTLSLDLGFLGLPWDDPFEAHDELTGTTYTWQGAHPYVRLDPRLQPAHVLHLRPAQPPSPAPGSRAARR